jgi:hypothetical protein
MTSPAPVSASSSPFVCSASFPGFVSVSSRSSSHQAAFCCCSSPTALGLLGNSWLTLAIAAFVLLVVGSLFEKMRARVRAARTYLAGLR